MSIDATARPSAPHPLNEIGRAVLHRWPSALGLAAVALMLITGAERESVATIVAVATVCYLGAAALNRRWIAWVGIPGGTVVITLSEFVGLPWWVGLAVTAVALVGIGVAIGAPRPALTAQTVALVGYGSLAVAALFIAPSAGLILAGAVLTAHGIWDIVHFRRNAVVSRSLAEFCMLLDIPLGLATIGLAVFG